MSGIELPLSSGPAGYTILEGMLTNVSKLNWSCR